MIKINSAKEDAQVQAEHYFKVFAKEEVGRLNQKEFNEFLGSFLDENNRMDLLESLKSEDLFCVYLPKNEKQMRIDEFMTAFSELSVMVKINDGDLDFDFKFEESDFQF